MVLLRNWMFVIRSRIRFSEMRPSARASGAPRQEASRGRMQRARVRSYDRPEYRWDSRTSVDRGCWRRAATSRPYRPGPPVRRSGCPAREPEVGLDRAFQSQCLFDEAGIRSRSVRSFSWMSARSATVRIAALSSLVVVSRPAANRNVATFTTRRRLGGPCQDISPAPVRSTYRRAGSARRSVM